MFIDHNDLSKIKDKKCLGLIYQFLASSEGHNENLASQETILDEAKATYGSEILIIYLGSDCGIDMYAIF